MTSSRSGSSSAGEPSPTAVPAKLNDLGGGGMPTVYDRNWESYKHTLTSDQILAFQAFPMDLINYIGSYALKVRAVRPIQNTAALLQVYQTTKDLIAQVNAGTPTTRADIDAAFAAVNVNSIISPSPKQAIP